VKTAGKAGAIEMQHNQAQARTASAGLKVRPGVKADAPAVSEMCGRHVSWWILCIEQAGSPC